jgi:hypothetical protein
MLLTREQIIEAVKAVRGGTITRVVYKTEVPIKAEYKKKGYKLTKIVETSARIGVNYGHIASVKAKNEEHPYTPSARTNNYEWVIKDRIRHNTNTGKDYVVLISFNKGHNTRVKYVLEGTMVGTIDMGSEIDSHYRHIVLDSYFKPKSTPPTEIRNVAFENIIKINNVGTELIFE